MPSDSTSDNSVLDKNSASLPPQKRKSSVRGIFLLIGIGWTVIVSSLCAWNISALKKSTTRLVLSESRSFFELLVTSRYWNALHGGVYVPVTPRTRPNPYLDVPDRDVKTENGKMLTLINPAYMTRQISELADERDKIRFHITSLTPINPGNAPNQWEVRALESFKRKGAESFGWERTAQGKIVSFRYMAPLWADHSCMKCHRKQVKEIGELRGGISVVIPAGAALAAQGRQIAITVLTYFILWLFGLAGAMLSFRKINNETEQRNDLIDKLQKAIGEVKTLEGFIPICSSCKKIRNDAGYWERIENYIKDRSDAEFSHSICPECARKLYPEFVSGKYGSAVSRSSTPNADD